MVGKTNAITITQSGNYEAASVTISASGTQTVNPSYGYDALSSVTITTPSGTATTPTTTITANPTITVSSGGLITATVSDSQSITPTVSAGYVSAGTAGTVTVSGSNTNQLSTKSAQTYYVDSSDRTISSGQFLTGTQTIKGVKTSGITASNIKKGSVITVGDSTKSDRILEVTGTYEPTLETVSDTITTNTTTTYTPSVGYDGIGEIEITTNVPTSVSLQTKSITIASSGTQQITADGGYDGLQEVDITTPSGTATTPSTTITTNPTITVSSGGLITASYSGSQSVTPTVSTGWVASGTAGTITVSGSNTKQLTTQGATTYYTSSTDRTIPSGTYLTGNQTIKAVTTTNLSSSNIRSGVTVEVGDSVKSDRIASVTGSYSPTLETISDTITTNTTTTYTPSAGYDGIGSITITTAVPSSVVLETLKSVTISSSGTTNITPSTGYDAMEQVNVTVASGSATTPTTTITATPSITVSSGGLITATASASQSVTPTVSAGYVSSGTSGTVSVTGSNTEQLDTVGANTYFPVADNTIREIEAGKFLTGDQTIYPVSISSNLVASNIKNGVTIEIGDPVDSDRLLSVTGTYAGAGSYTLLGTTSITTSSTSTTASSIGTLNLGSSAWDDSKIIYVRIRASRGKYSGYFYGSDSFLLNGNAANGSTTNATNFIRTIMRYYNNQFTVNVYAGTTCYGIYPYSLSNTGVLNIYRRYNTSISGTINDTFTIEAYLLNTPDGVSPFA